MDRSFPRARGKLLAILALILLAFALVACGPEANRVDGDGKKSGADVGNWGDPVQLHGDDEPATTIFFRTPDEQPVQ
jgi:hypothetical protein